MSSSKSKASSSSSTPSKNTKNETNHKGVNGNLKTSDINGKEMVNYYSSVFLFA